MAANTSPIFPLTPVLKSTSFAAQTACTTRAPTATAGLAAANIINILDTSTNGQKVTRITVEAASSSFTAPTAGMLVGIWIWDGTTAYLFDEITISAVTPSTTSGCFSTYKDYTDLVLPSTHKLYGTTSVTTTASTTAFVVHVHAGAY